ncbi:hypothetical protein [Runella aurantiaca]|uniref:Uncharacterized protein n=1 Tax=Runella aurantiaca TaxID=2282308 RepID=A0A369IBG4_9BACT|nr:hypothetical protein [Runella aurantiaca]RDB07089.1 hypothetical protein DVG78_03430 [Runella aurantiaca]
MTDTPDFIVRKQFEIIQSKTVKERFEIFDGMMSFVRQMTIKRIKKRLGEDISDAQLKYELIKEYYGAELPEEQMAEIKMRLVK